MKYKHLKARRFLRRYKKAIWDLEELLRDIDDIEADLTAIGGFDYGKDRVISSPEPDAPYVRKIERLRAAEELFWNLRIEANCYKQENIEIIKLVEPKYQALLKDLYVELKEWHDIFKNVDAAQSTCYAFHNEGLRQVEAILNEKGL